MPEPVAVQSNVVVATGGGRDLHADIYRPDQPNGAGVLMIHGGGWRMGSKDMMPPQAKALAGHGFTCAAVEYRLTPEAPWPAQIHDVKASQRWFRANAAGLGVDPDKIAVLGNSAGGHLALLLAGTVGDPDFEGTGGNPGVDTSVTAVIAVYPPVLFHLGERTSGANAATALLGDGAEQGGCHRRQPHRNRARGLPADVLPARQRRQRGTGLGQHQYVQRPVERRCPGGNATSTRSSRTAGQGGRFGRHRPWRRRRCSSTATSWPQSATHNRLIDR